ncbi:MAG: murein hydrolase activator EnvC family protein, partial [Muribaculaceae bacterium]
IGVCRETDDMGKVRREQSDVRRKVRETSGQLDANRRKAAQSLRELNAIDADIDRKGREIRRMEQNVAACDARIALITDSIKASEARLVRLRSNYAAAVRKMQHNLSSADRLSFILSSSSLHEAWRRMRYLKQFSKWRDRQAEEIHGEIVAMDRRRRDVEKLRGEQTVRNRALQNAKAGLEQQRSRQSEAVAQLKSEEMHLKGVLEEQNRRAEALDRELDRLIRLEEERVAEEQRKERERKLAEERRRAEELEKQRAAEAQAAKDAEAKKAAGDKQGKKAKSTKTTKDKKKKGSAQPVVKPKVATPKPVTKPAAPVKSTADDYAALTGSFESNKGKLPYPIGGSCRVVRTFGKQRHPELRHVMTDNGGIDLEAAHGAVARAVAAGKVSAVFSQPGYGMVVMVRHGHYLTIYVGLESLTVTTGTPVKAGQALGTVMDDADGGGKALLHFEIRHEKTKLNPMEWLR